METLQSVPRDKDTLDHFQILLSLEGKEEVEREVICFRWVPVPGCKRRFCQITTSNEEMPLTRTDDIVVDPITWTDQIYMDLLFIEQ